MTAPQYSSATVHCQQLRGSLVQGHALFKLASACPDLSPSPNQLHAACLRECCWPCPSRHGKIGFVEPATIGTFCVTCAGRSSSNNHYHDSCGHVVTSSTTLGRMLQKPLAWRPLARVIFGQPSIRLFVAASAPLTNQLVRKLLA
jgi:hypothetical protein